MHPFATVLTDFLAYLRVEHGAARTTCKAYGAHLRHLHRWMQATGYAEPDLSDVTPPLIRRYLAALAERNLRPRSIRNYQHALRGLCAFAVKTGLRPDNPAAEIAMPKKDAPRREMPTDEQVRLLLEAVERDRNPRRVAQRRAVLQVLVFGALRRAEVCDLQVSDVNLQDRSVLIRSGKGGRSRSVWLPESAITALREWLVLRGACDHPYLFTAGKDRRLHFKGLAGLLADVAARAGLPDCAALKPHSLRHWRATDLMRSGADLKVIGQILGHSSIQTTFVYLHGSEQLARQAADLSRLTLTTEKGPIQAKKQEVDDLVIDLRQRQLERDRPRLRRHAR